MSGREILTRADYLRGLGAFISLALKELEAARAAHVHVGSPHDRIATALVAAETHAMEARSLVAELQRDTRG